MACQVSSLRGEILASNHKHDGAMDDERSGFRDQTIDDALWRTFTYNHGDVRITTADWHMEREALNQSILLAASAPVLMALLGSLGLLWIGLGKGLEPLNRMRDALRRRRADSVEPLQVAGMPSELQPLLETQNQLFLRIAQTIERERRLTDDAAHELRSPLTAIKTHLQVARMTDGAVREQALEHAEQGTDRMHRTLEQLLMLARVEGSLSFEDGVQCSAEQVARQAVQDAGGVTTVVSCYVCLKQPLRSIWACPHRWRWPRCATCWTTHCAMAATRRWSWRCRWPTARWASWCATTGLGLPKPTLST